MSFEMKRTRVVSGPIPATRGSHARDGSSEELARALVELERELQADPPELVVLADDSDTALAAALVASKLLIPVEAAAEATSAGSVNAALISQLTAA